MKTRYRFVSGLVLACALTACGDDPLAPFQPEISNLTDSFQLQATNVRNVTTTSTYTWRTTGTVANVNHSTTTTAGSARLVVRSANGTQLYDRALVASLNEQTGTAAAGDWTVQLVLSNFSGTMNFRLQKP